MSFEIEKPGLRRSWRAFCFGVPDGVVGTSGDEAVGELLVLSVAVILDFGKRVISWPVKVQIAA